MSASASSQIALLGSALGAVGAFLESPGGGMAIGFSIACLAFWFVLSNVCKHCKPEQK